MRLCNYGVVLRSIRATDLELVRQWRNALHVRENMEFQEEITPDAQQAWFAGLDLNLNLYLIIEIEGKAIGLVHIKEIDWEMRRGEAGVFIGETAFLLGQEAVFAVLALMDFAFLSLRMTVLTAKVKAGSRKILDFNSKLGYRLLPGQEGAAFVQLEVTAAAYLAKAKRLREFSAKIAVNAGVQRLDFEEGGAFWQAQFHAQ